MRRKPNKQQRVHNMILDARLTILKTATQLNKWALESEMGGWSTHQVDPMRALAEKLLAREKELGHRQSEEKV